MFADYLKMHIIVVIWGFTAIIGALLTIPAEETVFFRSLVASTSLLLLFILKRRSFKLPTKAGLTHLGVGFLVGIHWMTFFGAIKISNASIGLIGLSTTTLWVAFLEPLVKKKKVNFVEVFFGCCVVVGLIIIFRFEGEHYWGLCLSLISALLAAVFSVSNGLLTTRYDHHLMTIYQMAGACLVCAVALLFQERSVVIPSSGKDILLVLILALVCTVYPYSKSIELLRRISVFAACLIINLEPVYGIILAALLLGEYAALSLGFYLGAGIILTSVIAYTTRTNV